MLPHLHFGTPLTCFVAPYGEGRILRYPLFVRPLLRRTCHAVFGTAYGWVLRKDIFHRFELQYLPL